MENISPEEARREVAALNSLRHPHIVEILERSIESTDSRLLTIVMELLDQTLHEKLASLPDRIMEHAQACAIALGVALALEKAESEGIIHRDVKPANIMFATDGTVKVTDFGIAKTLENTWVHPTHRFGSPEYMAPEQWDGKVGPVTDVYALGIVLYQMVSGRVPFGYDHKSPRKIEQKHAREVPPALATSVPACIADVIDGALIKDPNRRPRARAFALALGKTATAEFGPGWIDHTGFRINLDQDPELQQIVAGSPSNGPTPSPPPEGTSNGSNRNRKLPWILLGAGVLALVTAAVIAAYLLCRHPAPTETVDRCVHSAGDYGRVTTESGACIGISSNIDTFSMGAKGDADENLTDIGRIIMKENADAAGRGSPITLVYIADLTDPSVAERESMMGIAAAQYLDNRMSVPPPISILFANAGLRTQSAKKVGQYLLQLIGDGNPRDIVGVVGPGQSRDDTTALVHTLAVNGIPVVEPTLSLDDLAADNQGLPYFQIGPQDQSEATAMVQFAKNHLAGTGWPETTILTTDDAKDRYPADLADDLKGAISREHGMQAPTKIVYATPTGQIPAGSHDPSIDEVAERLCGTRGETPAGPYKGVVFFAGRGSDDFKNLRIDIANYCGDNGPFPTIVAGDDIAEMMANPQMRKDQKNLTFYYVSFADQNIEGRRPCNRHELASNEALHHDLCDTSAGIDAHLDERALVYYDAVNAYFWAERRLPQPSTSYKTVGQALKGVSFGGASADIDWRGSRNGVPLNRIVIIVREATNATDPEGAGPSDPSDYCPTRPGCA